MKNLSIIGGGSWGTALAIILAPRFDRLTLWVFETDLAERMQANRINDVFLPGAALPANVSITSDLLGALDGAGMVLSVMPSHLARSVYERMLPGLNERMTFVSATKGLENHSLLRITEVIREVTGNSRVAVLSGPSFAREVAHFEPTAVVAASTQAGVAETVQAAFSGPTFRVYTSNDPTGVEIGGSIKNVVALGAGVLHGMGLGTMPWLH